MIFQCDGSIRDQWIGDSGATHNITNSKKGLYNVRDTKYKVMIGNGTEIDVSAIGDLGMKIKNKNGSTCDITLRDVSYIPEFLCNLRSLTYSIDDTRKDLMKGGGKMILSNE